MPTQSELVEGFRGQAAIRPEAPALFWRGAETSYGELGDLVEGADNLRELG